VSAGPRRRAPAFSAPWLARHLRELIGTLRGAQLCVAYSGGADSMALLAALAAVRARCGFALRAVHVNHQLQPQAGAMAAAAVRAARQLEVECEVLRAPVRAARGESIEAAARSVRYAALQARLGPGEWLLLAQHREDQFETVLLQLLRGAGVAGLAAMPEVAGKLVRPLLEITRAQLRAWLQRRGLAWSDDPSNEDERFDRNYLRRRLTPLIEARWPAASATVARSARLAAEAQTLLETLADRDLRNARHGAALQVAVLRRLGAAECRNALRRWLALMELPLPDQRRLQEIAGPMLRARYDAQPQVAWPGAQVRRHRDLLYAMPAPTGAATVRAASAEPLLWDWRVQPRLALPAGGSLRLRQDATGPLFIAALPAQFAVRFRLGGERLAARHGQQTLKRLLQEHHLPPWLRSAVPLLYRGERLVAVADWWCEAGLSHGAPGSAPAGGPRARLQWTPPGE
jgi:tRNA(Ile)-lysidine synthase